ncbi:MAG TPA: TonB family protein [Blastocatellia bacterium]|nr:TonB family protein [Blastocatellia bacterium]
MSKMNPAFRILALSLSLFVIPAFAQREKPLQSYGVAMEAFGRADYKSAVDHFRQAIAERPSMLTAHYYLGLSLYILENYAEALSAYQDLIRIDPNNIPAHYQIAKIHLTIEDYRSAVEEYRWLRSQSEKRSNLAVEIKGVLLPDFPGEAINDWHRRHAGEMAQYLLDMIPRDVAEQYDLPASQIVYYGSSACLIRSPRPNAAGDSKLKLSLDSTGDSKPRVDGVVSGGNPSGIQEPPPKPDYPVKQDGDSSTHPMSASLRPTILYREKAKYTEVARINRVQGTVVLNVVFSVEGKIKDIRVIRCLPDGLTQNVITAAQQIRFDPAIKNGTPVSVRGQLEFTFNLY